MVEKKRNIGEKAKGKVKHRKFYVDMVFLTVCGMIAILVKIICNHAGNYLSKKYRSFRLVCGSQSEICM